MYKWLHDVVKKSYCDYYEQYCDLQYRLINKWYCNLIFYGFGLMKIKKNECRTYCVFYMLFSCTNGSALVCWVMRDWFQGDVPSGKVNLGAIGKKSSVLCVCVCGPDTGGWSAPTGSSYPALRYIINATATTSPRLV